MNYKAFERGSSVVIKNLSDFEPVHIFECGQCFRWNRNKDDSYTGVVGDRVLKVKKSEDEIEFANCTLEEFENFWKEYFDLERDYSGIKNKVSIDSIMKNSVEFGHGIRLLRQDPWEILISFIISARNSIPSIKKTIEKLSRAFGEYIGEFEGEDYYQFPTSESISELSEEDIRQYGTSFRTKYIIAAAEQVVEEGSIGYLKSQETDAAREKLMEFSGVGPKVSDCILLFGLSKYDVFPVDVWVQRVMDEYYLDGKYKNLDRIREYGLDMFGEYAGFGQQYLFYYAREHGVGKKKK